CPWPERSGPRPTVRLFGPGPEAIRRGRRRSEACACVLNPLLEDDVGEGVAGRGREEMWQAGRDHQPVAGMQKLELAAHQMAAADFELAAIRAAFLGAAIRDAALPVQHMDIIIPVTV